MQPELIKEMKVNDILLIKFKDVPQLVWTLHSEQK